jgi:hypothetical protein
MAHRFSGPIGIGALLLLACGMARLAVAAESEISRRDYNAVREYSYRYFASYTEKYGFAMRLEAILKACELKELASQVDRDLRKVPLYAGDQFAADPKATLTSFDLSSSGMVVAVALATQSLVEGYELGYLEVLQADAKQTPLCTGAGKAYDEYLKRKAK